MIIKGGNINISAINVPGGYVQVIAPPLALQGAPSNIIGIVGTATWGPVNSPVIIGDYNEYVNMFGPVLNGANDIGTQLWLAMLQGANNFRVVRVSDGTDAAATAFITMPIDGGNNSLNSAASIRNTINDGISGVRGPSKIVVASTTGTVQTGPYKTVFTSKYTGSYGNQISITASAGSKPGTVKVSITMQGQSPETFDNIVVSPLGTPGFATVQMSGGADGNSAITSSTLVGTDGTTRTGMYALRDTGCSVAFLSGNTDTTTWPAEIALANSEGWEAILTGPAGQSVATAITAKTTAAVDDTSFKILIGDWVYFLDTVNKMTRLVSPQGISAGIRSALSPEQSVLNKQVYGFIATQKTNSNQVYSYADLSALASAGIDVIGAPSPGGNYFSHLLGINGSSNAVTMGDEYTTLTNYLSKSINNSIGVFVGQLQTPDEQRHARDFIEDWLQVLADRGMIQEFSVQLNASNNPQASVALGFQIANVSIRYFGTVRYFIVNLVGGSSVKTTVVQA